MRKQGRALALVLALVLALSLCPMGFASSGAQYTLGSGFGKDWGTVNGVRTFEVTMPVGSVLDVPVGQMTGSYSTSVAQNSHAVRVTTNPLRGLEAVSVGSVEVNYATTNSSPRTVLTVYVTVVPAAGYSASCSAEHQHRYKNVTQNATCTADGYSYRECPLCGDRANAQTIPAAGHSYTNRITRQPTATMQGVRTYTCSRCGDSYTEAIPAVGNASTDPSPSSTRPSTDPGTPATPAPQPTATPTSTPAPDSTPAPTQPGTSGHTHQYETKVVKEATCKSTGTSQEVCSICGAVRSGSTKTIPKTANHTWENKTTPATCTKTGSSWQQCSVCGAVQNRKTLPKTEHSYVEGAVVRQPTVTQTGQRVDRCSVCGAAKYVDLPKKEEEPLGPHTSGNYAMSKLSQEEIRQLLSANPVTPPAGSAFDTTPSCAAPYSTGKVKSSVLQAALNRLNALRKLAGLPSVALDSSLNENAQYGAVIIAAMGDLSHNPPKQSGMSEEFYKQAYSACASSNLAAGRDLVGSIDMWMDDTDRASVGALGHRRWQLNPGMGKTGFGFATRSGSRYGSYAAEKCFDSSAPAFDYDFVGWPASGNFPSDLFDGYVGWSVSLNPGKYQAPSKSQVKVTLTRKSDGKIWTSGSDLYFDVDPNGYGVKNCIIFRPNGVSQYEGAYTVKIDGLKTLAGKSVTDFQYDVEFFALNSSAETGKPNTTEKPGSTQKPGASGTGGFADVPAGEFFAAPVAWAVENGITNGTSPTRFSPYENCTQAQILTFLYRAAGEPSVSGRLPFVVADAYRPALLWASSSGMIDASSFNPDRACTRATAVTYIWQAFGSPKAGSSSFTDVASNAAYAGAVSWAVDQEVTNGTSATTFSPNSVCNRGEIVTFLYRAYHS